MAAAPRASRQQLATHDRNGLARERYTVAAYFYFDEAATSGGLPRRERGPTETASPVGSEAAVRRSGHRILVDAGARGEVARHEVDAVGLGPCGDNDSAGDHNLTEAADVMTRYEIGDVVELRE